MTSDPRQVLEVKATLGEGPLWDHRRRVLWFVDIKAPAVHCFDPATKAHDRWTAPEQVGWVLPRVDGSLMAGLKSGPHSFDPETGRFVPSVVVPDYPAGNRLNDATTDPAGRIWFGTMDDGESKPTGRLYRWDRNGCVDTGLPPVAITNGPAISPDGRILYHTDTLGRVIWKVAIADNGDLGPPTKHIVIEDGAGYPDGSVTDAEGCLWVALYSGWGVRRYDPDGKLMSVTRLPVANVTKIAFGGESLTTAFATTARKGLDAAALAAQPQAGNLFAFDPGVKGLAATQSKI